MSERAYPRVKHGRTDDIYLSPHICFTLTGVTGIKTKCQNYPDIILIAER